MKYAFVNIQCCCIRYVFLHSCCGCSTSSLLLGCAVNVRLINHCLQNRVAVGSQKKTPDQHVVSKPQPYLFDTLSLFAIIPQPALTCPIPSSRSNPVLLSKDEETVATRRWPLKRVCFRWFSRSRDDDEEERRDQRVDGQQYDD